MNAGVLLLALLGTAVWGGLRLARCNRCSVPFSPVQALVRVVTLQGICGRCRGIAG